LNPNTCNARNKNNRLSRCPSNTSPHPVRRGGICHQLNQGVPKQIICERADVSRRVLNRHYDLRTKQEARKQRRKKLQPHLDGYENADTNANSGSDRIKSYQLVSSLTTILTPVDVTRFTRQSRRTNGTVGLACYFALIIVDLWLIGIRDIFGLTNILM